MHRAPIVPSPRPPARGLWVAAAFASGLAVADGLRLADAQSSWVWIVLAGLGAARLGRGRSRLGQASTLRPWLALFLTLGIARAGALHRENSPPPRTARGELTALEGRVERTPLRRPPPRTRRAEPSAGRSPQPVELEVRCRVTGRLWRIVDLCPRTVLPRAGDLVLARGRRGGTHRLVNPGTPTRTLPRYAGTLTVRRPADLKRLEGLSDDLAGSSWIPRLRGHLFETIRGLYDAPTEGLILSIVLGDRRRLDPDLRDALIDTGCYHFLAISGVHVGIAMLLVFRIPLPRGTRTLLRAAFLLLFCLLSGASTPVMRATLMLGLHLVLERLGRRPRPLDTLGWAAVLLLAAQPTQLWSAGFQLSFVAVAAIITDSESQSRRLPHSTARSDDSAFLPVGYRRRRLRDSALTRWTLDTLRVSVVTSLATMPLVLWHFHRVHPLAPIATLLVYPLAVALVLGGFLSLLVGLISLPFASLIAGPVALAADLLTGLLAGLRSLPGTCFWMPRPSTPRVAAAWLVLVLASRPPGTRAGGRLALATLLVVLSTLWPLCSTPPTRVICFDVGAGSALLIDSPRDGRVLVDAGSGSGNPRPLRNALLALGVARIDHIFLTHQDADHVASLPALLESLAIRRVHVSQWFDSTARGRGWLECIDACDVSTTRAELGDCWRSNSGRVHIEVLHPTADDLLERDASTNDLSLALRLNIEGRRWLIPGDLEERGLARLLAGGRDLSCDVLVLPHHGRRNLWMDELVARCAAREIVVSGDGRGGARDIARTLEHRGHEIWATWREGAVVEEAAEGHARLRYWRVSRASTDVTEGLVARDGDRAAP